MILKEMISLHRKFLGRAVKTGLRNISTSKALLKNYYETLGVKPDATFAEIKNAYFKLSKIYHPDRIAATDENLEKFREITTAYEVLGNEQSRKLYDRGLFDTRTAGLDVSESDDPIVKFYKQQDISKAVKAQATELDAWTQTYYKQARQKVIKQNEFFKDAKKGKELEEGTGSYLFVLAVSVVLMNVVLFSNIEGHPFEKFKRKYLTF